MFMSQASGIQLITDCPVSGTTVDMSTIQMDASVEDFFDRIRELDKERTQKDEHKRLQRTKNTTHTSVRHQHASNTTVPAQHQATDPGVDELMYESAYNYDKSRDRTRNPHNNVHDDEEGRPSIPSRSKSNRKAHQDLEIVRFDDFVTKSKPSYSTQSRFSKFELTAEEKNKIDGVISGLIGDNKSSEEEHGPSLPRRRKDPTRQHTTPSNSRSASPMKRSPAKVDNNKFTDDGLETRPRLPSRKFGIPTTEKPKPVEKPKSSVKPPVKPKDKWISAALHSSSTLSQGVSTAPNFSIEKTQEPNKWLNSAKDHSSSTIQGLETTPKLEISDAGPSSWLKSAKKTTSSQQQSAPKSKLPPIVPSKTNTLIQKLKQDEDSKSQQEKMLEELSGPKLNHVGQVPPRVKPKPMGDSVKPVVLKKTRPSVPSKSKDVEATEAELVSSKLSLAVPIRKPSVVIPEALKATKSLKPPAPQRRVSTKIPEALAKKDLLKKSQSASTAKEESVPEALKRAQSLKPSIPMRKPSAKQLEAVEQLNKIKKSEKPMVKPKPRVVSNTRENLNSRLKGLKPVKKDNSTPPTSKSIAENEDPRRAILERVLQRVQTAPVKFPVADSGTELPSIRDVNRASTFDSSQLKHGAEELVHITKTRSKGPKRRAPRTTT